MVETGQISVSQISSKSGNLRGKTVNALLKGCMDVVDIHLFLGVSNTGTAEFLSFRHTLTPVSEAVRSKTDKVFLRCNPLAMQLGNPKTL